MRGKVINTMLLAMVMVAVGGGCDFTVPLVTAPDVPITQMPTGLWQSVQQGGPADKLLVLPMGSHEMLVSYPAGKEDAMFARACLWRGKELTLLQLQWLGSARGMPAQDDRVFQFASCEVKGDSLYVRLLNAEILPRNIRSTDELIKAIDKHREHKKLFRPALEFQRIK